MKKLIYILLTGAAACCLRAETPVVLKNGLLEVSVEPGTGRFSVQDIRSGQVWSQLEKRDLKLSGISSGDGRFQGVLTGTDGLKRQVTMELAGSELVVTLSGDEDIPQKKALAYPYPILPRDQDVFILPEHEGAGIPVRDFSIMDNKYASEHIGAPTYNKQLRFYSGHDLSMTFWGYAGEKSSCMSIVETPNDASLRMQSVDGKLMGGIEWEPSRGAFGYSRTIRYVFLQEGGYRAICKRYRDYAFETGMLKTLAEKAKTNPNVMRFAGNALVWIFSPDTDVLVPQMLEAGMTQLSVTGPLFTPGEVVRMNQAGVLNGVYDCTRSVLPTELMDKVFRTDPCDVRDALASDIILMTNGVPFDYGWPKNGYSNKVYRTLDVCDSKQLGYAKARLDQNLEHRPMSIRFYDTITAFPWTECYNPAHPTTRSQVREGRMSVLKNAQNEGMVVGAEAGHIFAAFCATYFEGMNHSRFFYYQIKGHPLFVYDRTTAVPAEHLASMKEEYKYRLPLWELVAHDCVIAHTRWNVTNNKIHSNAWWDHMDLWDILYGTPPMYMFINEPVRFWETYKERYLQSYRNVVGNVLSKVAGQEMTDHRYLTSDKTVQKTTFANGVEVVVNFGEVPFELGSGTQVEANNFTVITPAGWKP